MDEVCFDIFWAEMNLVLKLHLLDKAESCFSLCVNSDSSISEVAALQSS